MSYTNDGAPENFDGTDQNASNYTSQESENPETTGKTSTNANADFNIAALNKKISAALAMTDDEFFASRPWLKKITAIAHGQFLSVGRWAVLAEVLAFLAARLMPNVRIEGLTAGIDQPLNLFVINAGISGLGKGNAWKMARRLIPTEGVMIPQPASGEAIPAIFVRREPIDPDDKKSNTQPVCRTASAIIRYPEAGWLSGASSRQGSTLIPTLESAFSGEQLGGETKKVDNTVVVPDSCYRLCVVIDAQPSTSRVFLDHEGTGFPQRFVWTTPTDPDVPVSHKTDVPLKQLIDSHNLPAYDDRASDDTTSGDNVRKWLSARYQDAEGLQFMPYSIDQYMIHLPHSVKEKICIDNDEKLRTGKADPNDAHRGEILSRISALIAVQDQCGDGGVNMNEHPDIYVGEEEWALAERVMAHSDQVRNAFLDYARKEEVRKSRARLETRIQAQVSHYQDVLVRRLKRRGPCDKHDLLNGTGTNQRSDYEQALDNETGKRILVRQLGVNGRSIYYLRDQANTIDMLEDATHAPQLVMDRNNIPSIPAPLAQQTIPDLRSMGFNCNYIPFDPAQNRKNGQNEKACLTKLNGLSWRQVAEQDVPESRTRPEQAVAVAEIPGKHELIWDFDRDKTNPQGLSGFEWMETHIGSYGSANFPQTVLDRTPSGGYHARYRIPKKYWGRIQDATHNRDIPIDIRACQRGYVLGIGSRTSAGAYQLCDMPSDNQIPMLTGKMIRVLTYLGCIKPDKTEAMKVEALRQKYFSKAQSKYRGQMDMSPIPEGERNDTLLHQADGLLIHYPEDANNIHDMIFERGRSSGLDDKEIRHIWENAIKYARSCGARV